MWWVQVPRSPLRPWGGEWFGANCNLISCLKLVRFLSVDTSVKANMITSSFYINVTLVASCTGDTCQYFRLNDKFSDAKTWIKVKVEKVKKVITTSTASPLITKLSEQSIMNFVIPRKITLNKNNFFGGDKIVILVLMDNVHGYMYFCWDNAAWPQIETIIAVSQL